MSPAIEDKTVVSCQAVSGNLTGHSENSRCAQPASQVISSISNHIPLKLICSFVFLLASLLVVCLLISTHSCVYMWSSENHLCNLALSFHSLSYREQTSGQVRQQTPLHTELCHLPSILFWKKAHKVVRFPNENQTLSINGCQGDVFISKPLRGHSVSIIQFWVYFIFSHESLAI